MNSDERTRTETDLPNLRQLSLTDVFDAFAAGHEVPGSGSANALTAWLAACLVASVATKTSRSPSLKYGLLATIGG